MTTDAIQARMSALDAEFKQVDQRILQMQQEIEQLQADQNVRRGSYRELQFWLAEVSPKPLALVPGDAGVETPAIESPTAVNE